MYYETEAVQYLSVDLIDSGLQIRGEIGDDIGLARSMQEVRGMLQPIRVRRAGERYVVTEGDRRLRGAKLIKMARVPAIVESKELSDAELLHRRLICDLHHADLDPVARARAFQALIEQTGWQAAEAAAKCGISKSTLSKLLPVLQLPIEVQDQVQHGRIPLTACRDLAQIADPVRQLALAEQLAQGCLTRDSLNESLKAERPANSANKDGKPKRVIVPVARGESVTFSSPRLSLERLVAVTGDVHAKARAARSRGLELEGFLRFLRDEAKAVAVA